jgi:hypothetical protein
VLIGAGLGVAPAVNKNDPTPWQTFYNKEPPDPANSLTVFAVPSLNEGKDLRVGEPVLHYGIKVQIRSSDFDSGWLKGWTIQNYLCRLAMSPVSVPGDSTPYTLQNFTLVNDVQFLMELENGRRQVFFLNGRVTILEG